MFRNIAPTLLFAAAVFAQQDGGEPVDGTLDSVDVVGARYSEEALDTAANTTLFTSGEISSSGAQSVSEFLAKNSTVRLVGFTGNPNDGGLAMRGFGENSHLRVSVIIDGVRYNRADMGTMPWLQIPMNNIESIELIRGGNSARYGNNAFAGIVDIRTRDYSKDDILVVSGMYGSYDTYSVEGFGALSRGDFFANVDVRRYESGGYRDNSRSWVDNYGAAVGYFINENNTIAVRGSYSELYTQYPNWLSYSMMMRDPQRGALGTTYRSKFYAASLKLDSESARGKGFATLAFNAYDRNILSGANSNGSTQNDQSDISFFSDYEIELNRDLRAYFGLDAQYSTIAILTDSNKKMPVGPATFKTVNYILRDSDVKRFNFGVKAGAIYDFAQDFDLDLCARYDAAYTTARMIENKIVPKTTSPYYSIVMDDFFDEGVWQNGLGAGVSLNWHIDKLSSFYVKFDQLFRYPSTDEISLYQGYGVLNNIKFNKDLSPETGQNFEFGYKFLGKELTVNASLYALYMHDEIMCMPTVTPNGTAVNVNVPDTLRLGADLYSSYDVGLGGVYAGASFIDAQFVAGSLSGRAIPIVPWFNCFWGVFARPHERLVLTFQGNYVSTQYEAVSSWTEPEIQMPDYITFDLRLNVNFCQYASAYFSVDNIFNETYALYAISGCYYPAQGRMFKAGLTFKF